jgi:hypothetical protein
MVDLDELAHQLQAKLAPLRRFAAHQGATT